MPLKELIQQHFHEMSKGQRKVATHVMEHPHDVAIASAQEIGQKIGVSETTVIRFCHSLSMSGYAELQKTVRQQLFTQESSLFAYQQSKLALEEAPHFYEKVMEQDRFAIQETMKQIKEADYEAAIQKLSNADTIYILGLRSSYAAATWLSLMLGLVKDRVHLIRPEAEDVIQTISQMNESSVVLVISFHRYLRETLQIAQLASRQKAFLVGITDSMLAPVHQYSDLLFPIYSPNKSTIDATAALYSFLNAIVAGLSVMEKDSFEQRKRTYRTIESDFLFMEGVDGE
ncbi:MurR/RpiR family transcriptional regulator [Sporosarcina sp. 179-K 3D1 HS]|uniref:MurR/RpiR family transcriptional regulator n=1 Tax=Sporosarcina sp. 179-K 3D1 HS TaxID=3232169 RepID=UPI0039A21D4C